jgi:hypothetical protein
MTITTRPPSQDISQLAIEYQIYAVQTDIAELAKLNSQQPGCLAEHEPRLLSALTFLQLLCSALRETRLARVKHMEAAE